MKKKGTRMCMRKRKGEKEKENNLGKYFILYAYYCNLFK